MHNRVSRSVVSKFKVVSRGPAGDGVFATQSEKYAYLNRQPISLECSEDESPTHISKKIVSSKPPLRAPLGDLRIYNLYVVTTKSTSLSLCQVLRNTCSDSR
jgi:hypothetical protein